MIIDSHCHVYPSLSYLVQEGLESFPLPLNTEKLTHPLKIFENKIQEFKPLYRSLGRNYLKYLHKLQVQSRDIPERFIPLSDVGVGLLGASNTLIDNNVSDLFEHIDENKIDYTVIIAHPPFIPNRFAIHLGNNYKNIIPFVNIPYGTAGADLLLEHYIEIGAKGLKIHAASDGGEVMSDHYLSMLKVADKHSLPVIIHTGCIHLKPLYKDPEMGHAEKFQAWFADFPNVKFILAHMNYHYPDIIVELMEQYPNLYTDTSWQPTEVIIDAINKIGDDRIMFGSDWPLVGDNINICLNRVLEAYNKGAISEQTKNKVLGLNAQKLFEI